MPLTVTVAPPLEVTFPPLVAEFVVMALHAVVVTVARAQAAGAVAATAGVEYNDEPEPLVAEMV